MKDLYWICNTACHIETHFEQWQSELRWVYVGEREYAGVVGPWITGEVMAA